MGLFSSLLRPPQHFEEVPLVEIDDLFLPEALHGDPAGAPRRTRPAAGSVSSSTPRRPSPRHRRRRGDSRSCRPRPPPANRRRGRPAPHAAGHRSSGARPKDSISEGCSSRSAAPNHSSMSLIALRQCTRLSRPSSRAASSRAAGRGRRRSCRAGPGSRAHSANASTTSQDALDGSEVRDVQQQPSRRGARSRRVSSRPRAGEAFRVDEVGITRTRDRGGIRAPWCRRAPATRRSGPRSATCRSG